MSDWSRLFNSVGVWVLSWLLTLLPTDPPMLDPGLWFPGDFTISCKLHRNPYSWASPVWGKDHPDLSMKPRVSSTQSSLWLDGIWAFLPTLSPEGRLLARIIIYFKACYIARKREEKTFTLLFGIYFALRQLLLIFQMICGRSTLPDFSREEEKRRRKITLITLWRSNMGLKMEKEAAAMHSITSSKHCGGDALTTDSTLPEMNADPFFSKVTYFPQNLILIFSGNQQCQFFAKWLWQGLC